MTTEWPTELLADLLEEASLSYGIVQPGDEDPAGVPIVRVKDLVAGRIDAANPLRVAPATSERHSRTILRGGELLFSVVGSVGEAAVVPEQFAGWNVARAIAVLRPKEVSAQWLKLALNTNGSRQFLKGALNTTVQATLNLGDLKRVQVPMPALATRHAITDVVTALDGKIAANREVINSTWAFARASFSRDVSNVDCVATTLGEASARGWLRLGDGYRTKGSEYGFPGLRILRAGDLEIDRIAATGKDYVSYGYLKPIGAKASQAGDVVVTTKGTVGRVAVVPSGSEQFVYSPQLCFFRVLDADQVDRGFLSGWFRSKDFQTQAEMRMFKSDMAPYINLDDIRSMTVSVPQSMEAQRRIGSVQTELEQLAHSKDGENLLLASTRDELLPLLMSGNLRVKDAEKVVEELV